MKIFLPKSLKNPQGFTLVELLVVITIIAILSVVGLTLFNNTQQGARDAKRRADVDAIAKGFETHFVTGTTTGYPPVATGWFAGGTVPTDPRTAGSYIGYSTASSVSAWTVCASLENTVPTVSYCISNQQQ